MGHLRIASRISEDLVVFFIKPTSIVRGVIFLLNIYNIVSAYRYIILKKFKFNFSKYLATSCLIRSVHGSS